MKVKELIRISNDGHNYMIMEYLNGPSLKSWIREKKKRAEKLSYSTLIKGQSHLLIMLSLLKTVSYLHNEAGIVHRDIKPANVIVRSKDLEENAFNGKFCTTIVDFGISFCVKSVPHKIKNYFEMMTPTGTPDYKAPEMLGGEVFNEKIDVWALGITFFEMFKGTRMIKSDSELSIEVDNSKVKDLLKRMLKKSPVNRLSAEEAVNHSCFEEIFHKINTSNTFKNSFELDYDKFTTEFTSIRFLPICERPQSGLAKYSSEEDDDQSVKGLKGNSQSESLDSRRSSPNKSLVRLLRADGCRHSKESL